MVFEAEVSSTYSSHQLIITFELNDLLLGSKEVELAFYVHDWYSEIISDDDLLHGIFEFVVFLILNQKWYWLRAEKLMCLSVKFLVRNLINIFNITVGEMFE